MKGMIVSMWLLSLSLVCSAQTSKQSVAKAENIADLKPLKVGDKVPDLLLHNMLNYSTEAVRLSAFKAKLLILDFWGTYCGSCIAAFPKLESLQKQFGDKLQILLVTDQDKKTIQNFFDIREKRTGKTVSFPNVCSDSALTKLFPHFMVPHCVWINGEGVAISITGGSELTEKNIQNILDDKPVTTKQKSDTDFIEFDHHKPLFIQGNGGDGAELLWYTILTGYVDKLIPSVILKPSELFVMNKTIQGLYQFAYNYKFDIQGLPNNRILLEVADSTRYVLKVDNVLQYPNLYNYQSFAPGPTSRESFQEYMQADLKRYFGLDVRWEKRKLKCFVLTAKDTSLIESRRGKEQFSVEHFNADLANQPLSSLIEYLGFSYLSSYNYPILDETGINQNVDLTIEADLTNPLSINKALKKYKMNLIEAEREIEMLVLRERAKK